MCDSRKFFPSERHAFLGIMIVGLRAFPTPLGAILLRYPGGFRRAMNWAPMADVIPNPAEHVGLYTQDKTISYASIRGTAVREMAVHLFSVHPVQCSPSSVFTLLSVQLNMP